jgi:hypothetical protein
MKFRQAWDMNWESETGKNEGFNKASYRSERWMTHFEGTERNEISLGPVANGLYCKREKEGMFLLREA